MLLHMNFFPVNLCRRWLLLLLAFHGMEFLLLGQLASAEPVMAPLNFGTSTLDRAPWRGDWRRQLMLGEEEVVSSTSEQNRHRRRFLTLTAEQILHTECADDSSSSPNSNGGVCVTRVEWRTHADYGRNRRKCHWQMARSSSGSSSGWQPFTFFQEGAHLTGLATPLHSISISAASNSNGQQQRRELPAVESGGGHLLLLLAANSARLLADHSLLQQIGRLLANAENVNVNGNGEWRKPNCSQRNGEGDQAEEGEEQESWLDVELANGQRIGISPRDLAVEYSDANGTCALSMAQFGESTTEQLMPQPRLAIALPMRHCLFLDLAKRQLAFVPRKWPHQQQQQQKLEQYLGGDNGIDGEEEERPAGGGQQRREVDTWLSFALSLI